MTLGDIVSKCECREKLAQLMSTWRRTDRPKFKQDCREASGETKLGIYFWARIGDYKEKEIFKFELDSYDRGPRSKVLSEFSRLKQCDVPGGILSHHQERVQEFLAGIRGSEPMSPSWPRAPLAEMSEQHVKEWVNLHQQFVDEWRTAAKGNLGPSDVVGIGGPRKGN
ncbi:MAG: hypothetical protein DMG25_03490 [Acidobacteria bacterium]|nr:MAG: hypothetical protein DMG25_03490 [Acidobacteriota bacterium]PYV27206.1 MAG: hypothetical protein DMG27_04640 [Acidobacteriota bacterium]